MITNVYLSICIPTNGRIEILRNTLDSIFADPTVDYSDFEVVISDNSKNDDLLNLLALYETYPNIRYFKTNSEGFFNSANALKMAKGIFLKLQNNYTMFNSGGLQQLISFIKSEQEIKPAVFFTNGVLKYTELKRFNSFNSFAFNLSYWNTWSTGFSIWKADFEALSDPELNKFFPHTSLLLLLNNKPTFVINDKVFFINQEVSQKGGYNLFEAFCVDYLRMMETCKVNGSITTNTFNKIKNDLFVNFLVKWYYETKIKQNNFTYDLTFIRRNVSVYYSFPHYYLLILLGYLKSFWRMPVRILKFVKVKFSNLDSKNA